MDAYHDDVQFTQHFGNATDDVMVLERWNRHGLLYEYKKCSILARALSNWNITNKNQLEQWLTKTITRW